MGRKNTAPIPEAIPETAGVIAAQQFDQPAVPALHALPGGHDAVGLEAQVVHAVEHGRESRQPHGDHDALEVYPIAHMGGGSGYRVRCVQKGVEHLDTGRTTSGNDHLPESGVPYYPEFFAVPRLNPPSRFASGYPAGWDRTRTYPGRHSCTGPDLPLPVPGNPGPGPSRYRRRSVRAATGWAGYPVA